jgi:colicin import membrane protein
VQKPRPGIVVSSVAHVAALTYAIVGFSSATPFDNVEALPIEVITPAQYDAMTKGSKTSKKIEAPKVAAKKKADVPPPDPKPDNLPEAKQDVAAPPPPSAEKDEPKKAAEKAEPKPKPEKPKPEKKPDENQQAKLDDLIKDIQKDDKPKPPEKKTAEKKAQPVFDPSKIAALVDKRDPSRKAQAAPETASYSSAGTATGSAPKLSISQQQMIVGMIRDQISPCWNPPVGASGADGLDVLVHFGLNADGSLASNPRAVNSSSNPAFRAAVDSASRAVVRCAPLHLPQQYYEAWKEVTISFDPREMAGG